MCVTNWHGCYDDQWTELIVGEAFAHPAKFAPGLIERIYKHGFAEGYWRKGDVVGDPFGGIGGGGIVAAYLGLRWVGVELEERFCGLFKKNVKLHERKWAAGGDPVPVMVQGDSRKFAELAGKADAIVTSPPFSERQPTADARPGEAVELRDMPVDTYGHTPGQIGVMKAGKLDAVVTSPPFEASDSRGGTKMPVGYFDQVGGIRTHDDAVPDSPGQLGNTTGGDYWQAMAEVYEQCRLALKPGGVMAVVVKDYVKAGSRVPLCDDTLTLLETVGFEPLERVRAHLVKTRREPSLFGGDVVSTKERKSFFRRLAERNGSPRIDWEEVLICQSQRCN